MKYKLTCNCGYVHRRMTADEKRTCKCGATVWIKPRSAGHMQPMVTLPEGADLTKFLKASKHLKSKLEVEKW